MTVRWKIQYVDVEFKEIDVFPWFPRKPKEKPLQAPLPLLSFCTAGETGKVNN